jgi:UDP-3-O-[3-hydroxymyristoyl] glucosamine N-acyltransferase
MASRMGSANVFIGSGVSVGFGVSVGCSVSVGCDVCVGGDVGVGVSMGLLDGAQAVRIATITTNRIVQKVVFSIILPFYLRSRAAQP